MARTGLVGRNFWYCMNPNRPFALLGGLSPQDFMARHWQKKPLLVRSALAAPESMLARDDLFALATRQDVQSRLVRREGRHWRLRHGPLARRALPPLKQSAWTLLVQGVDHHVASMHELMGRFRFVPDARLDDAMVSYASDGGGVGAHVDSYDVFLLQLQGRRRWRIGPARGDRRLVAGAPLRILAHFQAQEEYLLQAGDMLYLPPGYAHEGVAMGPCMTCSIGFRAPALISLGAELMQHIADAVLLEPAGHGEGDVLYADAGQAATAHPARLPAALAAFAERALQSALGDKEALAQALGCVLTEPKAHVWFQANAAPSKLRGAKGLELDARTRMLYDAQNIFMNGESWRAGGADADLMRRLADQRELGLADLAGASVQARALLQEWKEAGWLHGR